jgi:hypothetical protein
MSMLEENTPYISKVENIELYYPNKIGYIVEKNILENNEEKYKNTSLMLNIKEIDIENIYLIYSSITNTLIDTFIEYSYYITKKKNKKKFFFFKNIKENIIEKISPKASFYSEDFYSIYYPTNVKSIKEVYNTKEEIYKLHNF